MVVVTTVAVDPVPKVYVKTVSELPEPAPFPPDPEFPELLEPVPMGGAAVMAPEVDAAEVATTATPVLAAAEEARDEEMDSAAVTGQTVVVTSIVSVTTWT